MVEVLCLIFGFPGSFFKITAFTLMQSSHSLWTSKEGVIRACLDPEKYTKQWITDCFKGISLNRVIDDRAIINSWLRSLMSIKAATQCSIVGQATLVGQCAGKSVWIDGQSPSAGGEAVTAVRYQITDACPPFPRSLYWLFCHLTSVRYNFMISFFIWHTLANSNFP